MKIYSQRETYTIAKRALERLTLPMLSTGGIVNETIVGPIPCVLGACAVAVANKRGRVLPGDLRTIAYGAAISGFTGDGDMVRLNEHFKNHDHSRRTMRARWKLVYKHVCDTLAEMGAAE